MGKQSKSINVTLEFIIQNDDVGATKMLFRWRRRCDKNSPISDLALTGGVTPRLSNPDRKDGKESHLCHPKKKEKKQKCATRRANNNRG